MALAPTLFVLGRKATGETIARPRKVRHDSRMIHNTVVATLLASAALVSNPALAANSAPSAVPIVQTVPDAKDVPYPGTITLDIDASDTVRGVYRVTETIPVAAGTRTLTLLYPQWLPGNHGPRGPLAELVDLTFTAGGRKLEWKRDPVEVFAFHVTLPADVAVSEVVAKFIHTSPLQSSEGRISMTPDMVNLQWERVSLYPAGHYVRQIQFKPFVTLPAGFTAATALDGQSQLNNRWAWAPVNYEVLVDSPIFAGRYFKKWDLGQKVTLNVMADKPEQLEAKSEHIDAHRALVTEARLAFGANHFDHYEFLLALSDKIGGIGLEHHRSSENQLEPAAFTEWDKQEWDRGLLPHEYGHSWSGKFRRPARLWTPDYRQPMQGDLLWTYEGQDQFWGLVLAARSGLQSKPIVLGQLATWAGGFSEQAGRRWRSVEDTGNDPVFAARKPKPFASLARSEDYYTEGALVWLEADQIIRAGTGGRKSIDDFAKLFFGMNDGDYGEIPFEVDEIVTKLNQVHPYDWKRFIDAKINSPGQPAPLQGIEKGGYKLIWKDEPNPYDKARFAEAKVNNLAYSLGVVIDKDAKVVATQWDGAAFNAGVVTGSKIVAVNGLTYDGDALKKAVTAAKAGAPLELLFQRGDRFQTVKIDYKGGLRYPWLEKTGADKVPGGLDLLLAPKRPVKAAKK